MTVRFVMIGTGFWGASWAPLLREPAGVELAALVDIDPAASARVAAEIGLGDGRCFTAVDDALAAGLDLDAALVVVQPEHHEAVTVAALRAGLHCLVEKPIAHTVASARAIVDEGRRAKRVVMVSQNYRFARAPRTVQRLVADGAVGAVEQVRVDFQTLAELEGFFTKIPEPIISRWFIHQGDLIRGVLGVEPVRVRATSWNPSWSRFEGNASCLVEMWTERGAHIVYTGTWASHGAPTPENGVWDIQGSAGGIAWAGDSVRLRPRGSNQAREVPLVELPAEQRAGALHAFLEAIATGETPETDAAANLGTLELLLAALASVEQGREVDVRAAAPGVGLVAASPSSPVPVAPGR